MSQRNGTCSIFRTFVILMCLSILSGVISLVWSSYGRFAASGHGPLHNPLYGRQFGTVSCRLPVLDPFDNSIKKHMRKVKYRTCPKIPSVVYMDEYSILRVNSSALGFFGLKNPSDLECTAEGVYRRHADKKVGFGEAIHVIPPVKLTTDFTRVRCKNGSDTVFDNIVAGITDSTRVGDVPVDIETDDQLSVFMFGIDSVSRSESIRSLPKTLNYLKEIGTYDFEGHMKIGHNTFPNIFPLLTGIRTAGKDDAHPTGYMDDWPWLWKNFTDNGYATLYAEDYPSTGTFNWGLKGFVNPPVDHYMRPFWLAMRDSGAFSKELTNTSKFYKFNNERKHTHYKCNQNTLEYIDLINYAKRFLLCYKGRRKFFFSFLSELTHHSSNYLNSADEDLRELFVWLHDQGFLHRMVVVFFSDHGHRSPSLRNTYIGRLEASMPMLHLLVPNRTKQKYPDVGTSLTRNTQRLTSNFDLRQTLLDILNKNYKHPSKDVVRGISLFREISESRSCADAGVLPRWCQCVTSHDSVIKNDSFVMNVVHHVVKYMNNIIGNASDCEEIKFYSFTSVDRLSSQNEQTKTKYRLVIETKPGHALFETMFEVDEVRWKFDFRNVDRINAYGNQSYCVDAAKQKPYCYCKGY